MAFENWGNYLFLHRSGCFIAGSIYAFKEIGIEIKFSKTQNVVFVKTNRAYTLFDKDSLKPPCLNTVIKHAAYTARPGSCIHLILYVFQHLITKR